MAAGQKIGDAKPVGVHGAARALKRFKALKKDRNSWQAHWQDICDFQSPRNVRLQNTKTNRGDSSAWQKILNSRGLRARRVLSAGMMAGMTSPARPWFRLATPDPELMEYASVKEWLDKVGAIMRYVFAKSNTYRVLHSMYGTLGDFGTAVSVFDEDYDNVIHLTPLLTGQYCIATDSRNRVSTLYREFSMTV